MHALQIFQLVHMSIYLVVASQLIFYLTVLSSAMKRISIENFLEQRKAIDPGLVNRIKIPYYLCLLSGAIMVGFAYGISKTLFISSIIAFVCLVLDISLALKYNGPINKLTGTQPSTVSKEEWKIYRKKWLYYINIRAVIISIGMLTLMAGAVLSK